MIKKFHKIKIFTILLMFIFSSLIFFSPNGKSNPLDQIYECKPYLIIKYNETLLQEPIIPYDRAREIPVTIQAKIYGPAADIVLGKIGGGGIKLIVDVSIAEVSEGCYASINPPVLQFPVSGEYATQNATISITIDQDLPAFSLKNVVVRMNSRRLGAKATLVEAGNFTQDIPFFVGYLPQLSFSYPDSNVKSISPDEVADFTIEIQNWGNGDTNVSIDIEDIPEGWLAKIVHSITLGTNLFGSTSNIIVSLNVKPPIDFGYHEDRAIIKVKMTPISYNKTEYHGEPHYLYFIVQSNGFSAPGFEIITFILAFIFVLFVIMKKKNKKISKNTRGVKKNDV